MPTTRSFRYQERTKDDLKERANMRGGNFDSIIKPQYKMYKVRDGKNLIRILPPTWDKPKHYGYDIFVNYNIGPDNVSYLSLSRMKQEADPIAEARREAQKEGNEELAKELNTTQRVLMWVIDRNDEDEGPMLWGAPITVDKAIANLSFDEDTKEVIFIDDPDQGCDIRFYREGTGLATKYDASKMKLMKASPLHEDEKLQNEWLEYVQQNSIPDCLQFFNYDYISKVFNGQSAKAEDEEHQKSRRVEPEDSPPAGRRNGRTPPADSDEEVTETPSRRPRPKLPADEDETPRRVARTETEDAGPAPGSIRERIMRRRQAQQADPEDE